MPGKLGTGWTAVSLYNTHCILSNSAACKSRRLFYCSENQHTDMRLIQPSHDPIACPGFGPDCFAILTGGTPAVDLAVAIINHCQFAHHADGCPLLALRTGNVFFVGVIRRIHLQPGFHMLLSNQDAILIVLCRNQDVFPDEATEEIGSIHPLPLVIVGIANHRRIAGHNAKDEIILRPGQSDFLTFQSNKQADPVFTIGVAIRPFKLLGIVSAGCVVISVCICPGFGDAETVGSCCFAVAAANDEDIAALVKVFFVAAS